MSNYKKPTEIIFMQNELRIDDCQSKKNIFLLNKKEEKQVLKSQLLS